MHLVQFEEVSKRYRLGLTRTSLPSLLSQWARRIVSGDRAANSGVLWALQGVSFRLGWGESLALVGPNGAGKTTILKLLASITKPTFGRIQVNGRVSALIELGAGFHPDLTGRENIYLNGTILGLKRAEIRRRFDEIVAFAELERFVDTPVKRYSSGMAVRLGFSVAACVEPDLLLVDEVLAVGDAAFSKKCIDRIKELLEQGTSILFVSHNLWLVRAVCRNALYINGGKLVCEGSAEAIVDRYDRDIHRQRAEEFENSSGGAEVVSEAVVVTLVEVISMVQAEDDLPNDQPAEVRVHYLAHREFGPCNLVVRIIRSDGLTCCMARTSLDQFDFSLQRGRGLARLILDPLQLYGGMYFAQAVLRDETDSWTLASALSEPFYVKGSVLSHQEMNGVYEPNRRWSHDRTEPPAAPPLSPEV